MDFLWLPLSPQKVRESLLQYKESHYLITSIIGVSSHNIVISPAICGLLSKIRFFSSQGLLFLFPVTLFYVCKSLLTQIRSFFLHSLCGVVIPNTKKKLGQQGEGDTLISLCIDLYGMGIVLKIVAL